MSFRIRHTHASGRFSRSPKSLFSSLTMYALISAVITMTEVTDAARMHAVTTLKSFASYKHPHSDAAIAWKARRFRLLGSKGLHVGETSDGLRHHIWGSIVALHDKRSKHKVAVSSLHLVSDVESAVFQAVEGHKADQRALDYHAMFSQWITQSVRFAIMMGCDLLILGCDSNLNYHKVWVQRYADQLTRDTGLTVSWDGNLPPANVGTHGRRLIDWGLIKGFVVLSIKVLAPNKASDHRAYTEDLRIR